MHRRIKITNMLGIPAAGPMRYNHGPALNKLFVAPIVADKPAFLRVLREPALHCSREVYVAMVPKPREWDERPSAEEIELWRIEEGEWG